MSQKKVNVALVGLGFGAEFIPIYQSHPNANLVALCQRTRKKLDAVGDAFGVAGRYTDYAELLKDPSVEAVHINSPIPDHAWMSLAALKAGKHVLCTVPMATTISDCKKIVDAVKRSGLKYMMAETVVYSREFLYIKELYDKGELGKLQFLQASHLQDMDGWPNYWPGLPPMWYATHCVAPMLALNRNTAESVSCFGSGTIRKELIGKYGSPFAVESAHIAFKDSDLAARIYRSLFDVARQYRESIDVYGSKKSHLSFTQGGGHGGSHPHLAHAFLSSLVEGRDPFPNARESANWTCVGLCAHQSALAGGKNVRLPAFTIE